MNPTAIAHLPVPPAKSKILEVADRLFYDEGIHAVGVDRIMTESQVPKATFYKHYRSKGALIVAYVEGRHLRTKRLVDEARAHLDEPADLLRALVALIGRVAARPGFHGCPFINAAAQFSDAEHPVRRAVTRHRAWERALLSDIVAELGYPAGDDVVDDLLLLRDGALSGNNVDDPVRAHRCLVRAVERVIAERPRSARTRLLSA